MEADVIGKNITIKLKLENATALGEQMRVLHRWFYIIVPTH